jgi:hypothetical protein
VSSERTPLAAISGYHKPGCAVIIVARGARTSRPAALPEQPLTGSQKSLLVLECAVPFNGTPGIATEHGRFPIRKSPPDILQSEISKLCAARLLTRRKESEILITPDVFRVRRRRPRCRITSVHATLSCEGGNRPQA